MTDEDVWRLFRFLSVCMLYEKMAGNYFALSLLVSGQPNLDDGFPLAL